MKVKSLKTHRINGYKTSLPGIGVVEFDENRCTEINDQYKEIILSRSKELGLQIIEDKLVVDDQIDDSDKDEIKIDSVENESIVEEEKSDEELNEVKIDENSEDVSKETLSEEEEYKYLLETMNLQQLKDIASEAEYPKKEWSTLNKASLKEYLIEKYKIS